MMMWGETLAIFTYLDEGMLPQTSQKDVVGETLDISIVLDEEMGLQTSPSDVVGLNSSHFHISGCRNGFTDISK